jgi:hypothetical protein
MKSVLTGKGRKPVILGHICGRLTAAVTCVLESHHHLEPLEKAFGLAAVCHHSTSTLRPRRLVKALS